jgi:hypothetical protein
MATVASIEVPRSLRTAGPLGYPAKGRGNSVTVIPETHRNSVKRSPKARSARPAPVVTSYPLPGGVRYRGVPAPVPALLQPHLARPGRRRGRSDGAERVDLSVDVASLRRHRPLRPRVNRHGLSGRRSCHRTPHSRHRPRPGRSRLPGRRGMHVSTRLRAPSRNTARRGPRPVRGRP